MLAIYTKYIGPTNTRPSRVKAYTSTDSTTGKPWRARTYPWGQAENTFENHLFAACSLAAEIYRNEPDRMIDPNLSGASPDDKGFVFLV